MAENTVRKSNRLRKLHREPGFVYDVESVEISSDSKNRGENWHISLNTSLIENQDISEVNCGNNSTSSDSLDWSDIYFLPSKHSLCTKSVKLSECESPSNATSSLSHSHQERQDEELEITEERREALVVNNNRGSRRREFRKNSSTRLDFLEYSDYFLSFSTTVRSDTSNMPSDNEAAHEQGCNCEGCDKDRLGQASKPSEAAETAESQTMVLLRLAIDKIDELSAKVNGLEKRSASQDEAIKGLKKNNNEGSGSDRIPSNVKSKSQSKTKKDRGEDEKVRQLKLMQEKLGRVGDGSNSERAESSDEEGGSNMKTLKKKMSKKQRDMCSSKVGLRLQQAGATFPEDDYDAASSAGNESASARESAKQNRQVRSGAKVKQRPVVRTELWPHTIAIEDDGEDLSSDNISLAKFFSCFTYIMLECEKIEYQGRVFLLHAVSMVLECVNWEEARTFHNLVMVKLEQNRIDWTADFVQLAENYIDKKVRLSLKAKSVSGAASSGRSGYSRGYGYSGRTFGKGFSSGNRGYSGRSKSLYNSVCKQWNYGTCSYGERCNLWHVCWSCAETGKVGELHKASSHFTSGGRPRQAQQGR